MESYRGVICTWTDWPQQRQSDFRGAVPTLPLHPSSPWQYKPWSPPRARQAKWKERGTSPRQASVARSPQCVVLTTPALAHPTSSELDPSAAKHPRIPTKFKSRVPVTVGEPKSDRAVPIEAVSGDQRRYALEGDPAPRAVNRRPVYTGMLLTRLLHQHGVPSIRTTTHRSPSDES